MKLLQAKSRTLQTLKVSDPMVGFVFRSLLTEMASSQIYVPFVNWFHIWLWVTAGITLFVQLCDRHLFCCWTHSAISYPLYKNQLWNVSIVWNVQSVINRNHKNITSHFCILALYISVLCWASEFIYIVLLGLLNSIYFPLFL